MPGSNQKNDPLFAGADSAKRSQGKIIGSGGETTVYDCPEAPGIALAMLHQVDSETEDRIRFYIAWTVAIGLLKYFAWPLDLLTDKSGRVVGYTMRLVKGDLLSKYLSPMCRPVPVSLVWMLEVFKQIAECIHAAHASGFRIGDLNCNNIMIKPDGQIVMLDVLSFYSAYQQKVFSTKSGVGSYLPPELLDAFEKGDLASQPRTTHGDSYSFGVLLFKAIFEFHPFANRELVDVETVVKSGEWPYDANSRKYHPKTASPPLTALPPKFIDLFTRCFVEGMKAPTLRPLMVEWDTALEEWVTEEKKHSKKPSAGTATSWTNTASSKSAGMAPPVLTPVPPAAMPASMPLAMLLIVLIAGWLLFFEPDKPAWEAKATNRPTPRIWTQLRNIPVNNGELR